MMHFISRQTQKHKHMLHNTQPLVLHKNTQQCPWTKIERYSYLMWDDLRFVFWCNSICWIVRSRKIRTWKRFLTDDPKMYRNLGTCCNHICWRARFDVYWACALHCTHRWGCADSSHAFSGCASATCPLFLWPQAGVFFDACHYLPLPQIGLPSIVTPHTATCSPTRSAVQPVHTLILVRPNVECTTTAPPLSPALSSSLDKVPQLQARWAPTPRFCVTGLSVSISLSFTLGRTLAVRVCMCVCVSSQRTPTRFAFVTSSSSTRTTPTPRTDHQDRYPHYCLRRSLHTLSAHLILVSYAWITILKFWKHIFWE